ncbi:thermonuclease family protein [Propionibacteriaceae bacterium Y2011]
MRVKQDWVGMVAMLLIMVTGCGPEGVAQGTFPEADRTRAAVVVRVVDGDTFDATIDGKLERIRLLNVDTPEMTDPNGAPECLAPEATRFLERRLAKGETVRLQHDLEHRDRYGRLLAGVYADGSLINEDIARAGLGVAVAFEPNRRYYARVLAAQHEAAEAAKRLHSATVACTLPGQVAAVTSDLESLATMNPTDLPGVSSALVTAAAALVVSEALEVALDTRRHTHSLFASAYGTAERAAWATTIRQARTSAEVHHTRFVDLEVQLREVEERRMAEERRKAEEARKAREAQEAAARKAQQEAAQRKAAEEHARQQAKRRAAAPPKQAPSQQTRRKATQPKKSQPKQTQAPKSSTKQNPYPGYTGPRCYAPGGKTWKPC